MKLLVGLGNPGKEYATTRHNIGWLLLDRLAKEWSATEFRAQKEFHALVSEARVNEEKILLIKPTTYMNNSGTAVQAILSYYHLTAADMLVVQDEMDYAVGTFAFAVGGGAAGHNGVGSIHTQLGTKDIPRLRLGISRPSGQIKAQDYVLQGFSSEEQPLLNTCLSEATKAAQDWIQLGLTRAMNSWNGVKNGMDQRTPGAPRLSPTPKDRQP